MSFKQMAVWTNVKTMQAGAGRERNLYSDYTNITSQEMRQHIGLYIFHGLAPLLKLSDKFKLQTEDVIHGRDFKKNVQPQP